MLVSDFIVWCVVVFAMAATFWMIIFFSSGTISYQTSHKEFSSRGILLLASGVILAASTLITIAVMQATVYKNLENECRTNAFKQADRELTLDQDSELLRLTLDSICD